MFSIRTTTRVLFAAAFVAALGATHAAEKPRNAVLKGQVVKPTKQISNGLHYANCDIGDLTYRSKAKQGTLQNGILQETAASQAYLGHKSRPGSTNQFQGDIGDGTGIFKAEHGKLGSKRHRNR